jgi:hypothetical protein
VSDEDLIKLYGNNANLRRWGGSYPFRLDTRRGLAEVSGGFLPELGVFSENTFTMDYDPRVLCPDGFKIELPATIQLTVGTSMVESADDICRGVEWGETIGKGHKCCHQKGVNTSYCYVCSWKQLSMVRLRESGALVSLEEAGFGEKTATAAGVVELLLCSQAVEGDRARRENERVTRVVRSASFKVFSHRLSASSDQAALKN